MNKMSVKAPKKTTAVQVAALMDFMQEHSDVAKGPSTSGLEKEDLESLWRDLAANLNSMGGAVKSVDKWKQTWRDLKSNTKKRALMKQHQSMCDTSMANSDNSQCGDQSAEGENYIPSKKKYVSFDEEIVRIEKEKLELDKEYKVQKIEALNRIAAALEALTNKRDNT